MENQHSSNGNQKRDFLLRLCVSVELKTREQLCAEPAWLVNAIRTAGDSRPYLRQVVSFCWLDFFCYCSSQGRLKRAIQSLLESR